MIIILMMFSSSGFEIYFTNNTPELVGGTVYAEIAVERTSSVGTKPDLKIFCHLTNFDNGTKDNCMCVCVRAYVRVCVCVLCVYMYSGTYVCALIYSVNLEIFTKYFVAAPSTKINNTKTLYIELLEPAIYYCCRCIPSLVFCGSCSHAEPPHQLHHISVYMLSMCTVWCGTQCSTVHCTVF